jgi:hypothetical protein
LFPLLELWEKTNTNLHEGLDAAALRQEPANRIAIMLAQRHPVDLCRCIAKGLYRRMEALYRWYNISKGGVQATCAELELEPDQQDRESLWGTEQERTS